MFPIVPICSKNFNHCDTVGHFVGSSIMTVNICLNTSVKSNCTPPCHLRPSDFPIKQDLMMTSTNGYQSQYTVAEIHQL